MAHRELFGRYVEALANPELLAEVLAPNFVAHDLPPPGGRDALTAFRRTVMAAFPDQATEILDYLEDGDRIAARMSVTQTHTQPFAGVAPTGRHISFEVYEFVRVDGAAVVERWSALRPSIGEMIQQLRSPALAQ